MFDAMWDKVIGGPERRAKVEEIASTIQIPSQPEIMVEINREFARKDVDFSVIADLVSRDVGLSAKLLKVANSPLFAAKVKVESIDQALVLLGARQFKQTILASALRQSMEGKPHATQEFWAHSEGIGTICDAIARQLQPDVVEYAYLTGLFHDCAVPILMDRSAEYIPLAPRVMGRDRTVAETENAECEIDHGSLGLVMTRSWSLPIPLVKVVRAHHSDDFMGHHDLTTTQLHIVLVLAENFYLYWRKAEDEIFGGVRNQDLLQRITEATGWSQFQILSLAQFLEQKIKG